MIGWDCCFKKIFMEFSTLTYEGRSFNQRNTDGYVNLGQLCATHGKRFSNWSRLEASNAYLEALSVNTQIRVLELVYSKQGNEGTWGHPLVAIEVARWISPAFGVWCNQHIRQLMETGHTAIAQPESKPVSLPQIKDDVDTLVAIAESTLAKIGVAPEIYIAMAVEKAQELSPLHENILSPIRQHCNNITVPDNPVTPTQIGKELGISAIKVNRILIEKGLQVKNESRKSRKEPTYLPTTKGSEWAVQQQSKGQGDDNTTYYQLRWYPSVIELLR